MAEMMIGEKIKQMRTNSGLRQTMVADYLRVDQSYISKIEKSEREIGTDIIKKLSELFCRPVSEFISADAVSAPMNVAFRTNAVTGDDLRVIAAINRIALNLDAMDRLAEEKL